MHVYIVLLTHSVCIHSDEVDRSTGSVDDIINYYTALLSAAERSVYLPSRLPLVNYFSIITVANHIMTAVKESGFFFTSLVINPQVVR